MLASAAVAVLPCRPEPEVVGSEPEPDPCPEVSCPASEVQEVVVDSLECRKAKHVLTIRNARLDERMDECEARGNSYVDCSHWVFGYLPPDGTPTP
jgi:hypothetical protein